MKKLAKEIFKVPKGKTFAIRARRTGSHNFTSQDIGHKVGWIIEGRADLTKPDKELFIECRQKKTYIFTDKISGPGGLPLGSAGKIIAVLNDKESVGAAWMMMKRGCQIIAAYKNKKYLDSIRKWHIGRRLDYYKLGSIKQIIGKTNTYIICVSEGGYKLVKNLKKVLILRPLVALEAPKGI